MVLPTLPSFLELKKVNFHQEFLKNKHTSEFVDRENKINNQKYFKDLNVTSMQHETWTSDKSFNKSMMAYTIAMQETPESKDERKKLVQARQQKIKELFRKENEAYEAEMKRIRAGEKLEIPSSMNMAKSRLESIRQMKEDERRKLAEEKLYENWRLNNPELRNLESKKLNDLVVGQWKDQVKEREEAMINEKNLEFEFAHQLDLRKARDEQYEQEQRQKRKELEVELKEILKQQMIEIKQREAEEEGLRIQEAELTNERVKLLMLEEERKAKLEQARRQEYGQQLLRQHKAKLRKRAKEIQDELEFDIKFLQMITELNEKQKEMQMVKKEQARQDAERMIEVLNQQLRLEKEREAELDFMFQDEAQKQWDKRNQEWSREAQAREMLMKQVLDEVQKQINYKIEIINEKKKDSLLRRKELIEDMERGQALIIQEREKAERAKLELRDEFTKQIMMQKNKAVHENLEDQVNVNEHENIESEKYKAFMDNEKAKIESNYQVKVNTSFSNSGFIKYLTLFFKSSRMVARRSPGTDV